MNAEQKNGDKLMQTESASGQQTSPTRRNSTHQNGNVFLASVAAKTWQNYPTTKTSSASRRNSVTQPDVTKTNGDEFLASTAASSWKAKPRGRRNSLPNGNIDEKKQKNGDAVMAAVAAKKWQTKSNETASKPAPLNRRMSEASGLRVTKSNTFSATLLATNAAAKWMTGRRSSDSQILQPTSLENSPTYMSKGAMIVPVAATKWRSKSMSPNRREASEVSISNVKRKTSISHVQTSTQIVMAMSKWGRKSKMNLALKKENAINEETVREDPEEPPNSILNNGFSTDFENVLKSCRCGGRA